MSTKDNKNNYNSQIKIKTDRLTDELKQEIQELSEQELETVKEL